MIRLWKRFSPAPATLVRQLPLLAAAVTLIACDRSGPDLQQALAHVQQISAEKDSLLSDLSATSQFVSDVNAEIDKARQLAKRRPTNAAAGETDDRLSFAERRAMVLQRVKELAARIGVSESRLAASRKIAADLASRNSALAFQVAAYDSTLASFKSIMDGQKSEIATLERDVASLTDENSRLTASNVALVADTSQLTDERSRLTTERNTVYYIIGTKEGLLRQHIVEEAGGLLGLGKVVVPARGLDASNFTSIDRTQVSAITFPKANTPYRIVTRQDLSALETPPDKHGVLMNALKIRDASAFWAGSKYLIVIEQ